MTGKRCVGFPSTWDINETKAVSLERIVSLQERSTGQLRTRIATNAGGTSPLLSVYFEAFNTSTWFQLSNLQKGFELDLEASRNSLTTDI